MKTTLRNCWMHAAVCAAAGALALLLAGGALAQEASPWSEDHASRARLLAGEKAGVARMIGLEIALDDGFKTYWRHPGDSGLPPEIDWSGSENVAGVEILFPAPERFEDASGVFFGYEGEVVLPLRVTLKDASAPMRLSIALDYGACKEICIPARAEMALAPPEAPAAIHVERIAAALERVPEPRALGEEGELAITKVEPVDDGTLRVGVRAPPDALLFAEGPDYRWFLAPEHAMRAAEAGEGVFTVELAERPRDVDAPVELVFTLAANGAATETRVLLRPEDLPPR